MLYFKNGLKISPKKCQLFRTELQYMGNKIFIQDRRVSIKPLRNRLEAITAAYNSKGVQMFCRNSKFSKYVLCGIREIIKVYI